MQIQPGTRLGPYEVVSPLGAGGMGEVWRARDTRLERSVAIKLLPAEYARNEAFRARFEREAKTISQLNDPRICTVHDIGQHDGLAYLVMELIEGTSLADRIARGAMPLDEVLRVGIDIARALERAHAAGIVHRDLKPGNIMLTKSGAKLLDFGLAKPQGSGFGAQGPPAEETLQKPITEQGTIIGTFQYMAPEQLEGQEADARTDIFAFGAVLYEMATGRRAFEGKTRTSLIAAIVDRDPPPISSIQPLTPPAFERVVATCLAKDPADRWQSAHDLRMQLEWLAKNEPAVVSRKPKRAILPWVIAAACAAAAIAALLFATRRNTPRDVAMVRTAILPPNGTQFDFFLDAGPAEISPDGTKIVLQAAPAGGVRSLWVRALNAGEPRKLPGTDSASHPFWSPDSRYVAFWVDGALMRIDVNGGAPVKICTTSDVIRGGTWSASGQILFGQTTDAIARVPAAGGQPVAATQLDHTNGETTHRWPRFLPDGKHFLYMSSVIDGDGVISVGNIETGVRKPLLQIGSNAVYHDGWILYARDQILTAQRFDVDKLEAIGDPVPLDEGPIEFDPTTVRSFFSISQDGTLLFQTGNGVRETVLTWFDRKGNRVRTSSGQARYGSIALSPDRRMVAHSVIPRADLWIVDLNRGVRTRFTFNNGRDFSPVWSPDGNRVVFSTVRPPGGGHDLYVKDLRTGQEQPLVVDEEQKTASSWSADGDKIFFTRRKTNAAKDDIEYFSFSDGKTHPVISGPFNESAPKISPDGKWLLYVSTETRPIHVYLSPFPPTGVKWQISSVGGAAPQWRGDGKEVFYFTGGQIVSVPVELRSPPQISTPVPLFSIPFGIARRWDVTEDGQQFIAGINDAEGATPVPLTLVQNFGGRLATLP